jgi:Gas vesicle synthesis protein GvpL/GvpF
VNGGDEILYVYAIAEKEAPEAVTGLHGSRLRSLRCGPLVAVVSEHRVLPEPDETELWAHESVVEKLMRASPVLPMRFGTTVEGEDVLIALIEERREQFEVGLERVRGAVELSVRAQLPELTEPASASLPGDAEQPGTTYLLGRARTVRHGEELAETIHQPLAKLARESTRRRHPGAPAAFRAAYLVEARSVGPFGEAVAALNDRLADVKVSCTGPWPPYSFVPGEER